MQRLGRVLHMTPSGSIIVKAEKPPRIGENVVNEKLEQIGTVFDVFGPVSSPYVAVRTEKQDLKPLENQLLYVSPSSKQKNRGKEKERFG